MEDRDRELLEYMRFEFRRVYNHYLRVIRETGTLSKSVLEKKTTINSRRKHVGYPIKSDILANTRQCARDKAVECVRLYNDLKERNMRTEFPEFMYETLNPRLNWRDGYRINPDGSIRISVKKGNLIHAELGGPRENLDLIRGVFNRNTEYKFTTAEISREDEDYFIHVRLDSNTRGLL